MKKIKIVLIIILFLAGCSNKDNLCIKNVKIVDTITGQIIENSFIRIEKGIITDVGEMTAYDEKHEIIIDGKSFFATPGLADMHVHTGEQYINKNFWKVHPGDLFITNGITTIRDAGFYGDKIAVLKNYEKIKGDKTIGPRIINCTPANYYSGNNIESYAAIFKKEKSDYIKLISKIPKEQMENILKYSEDNNIYTYGHLYSLYDLREYANHGFDELAHIALIYIFLIDDEILDDVNWNKETNFRKAIDDFYRPYYQKSDIEILSAFNEKINQIIDILKKYDIPVTTTLYLEKMLKEKVENPNKYIQDNINSHLPNDYLEKFKNNKAPDSIRTVKYGEFQIFQYRFNQLILKKLKENNIKLIAGSDSTSNCYFGIIPGESLHGELEILIENGFSNLESLQACTKNAAEVAKRMGIAHNFGEIEVGNVGDIILSERNPLIDIKTLKTPKGVLKSGVWYSDEDIGEILEY